MKLVRWMCILVGLLLLGGCSFNRTTESTEEYIGSEGKTLEEESTEDVIVATEEQITLSAEETEITNALTDVLWLKMLQLLDMATPNAAEVSVDQWSQEYTVEAYLKEFTVQTYTYIMRIIYPGEEMKAFVYYWPDYITSIHENYTAADEYLLWYANGDRPYDANSSWLAKARSEGMLQITGQVTSEEYTEANKFLDNVNLEIGTYYALWGTMLKVAGEQYLEKTGSIWGNFSGQIYMTDFNFDTLIGTFWICLDEMEPIQVSMRFHNRDCYAYFLEINDVEWDETVPDSAWLGLKFDLETSEMNQ